MYMVNLVGSSFHSPLIRYILSPLNGESTVSNPLGEIKIKDGGFAVLIFGIALPNNFSHRPLLVSLHMLLILTQPPTTCAPVSAGLDFLHTLLSLTQPSTTCAPVSAELDFLHIAIMLSYLNKYLQVMHNPGK